LNRTPPGGRGDFGYICLFIINKIKLCKKNKGTAAYHACGSYHSPAKVK
jgi:hypothetical protein